MMDEAPGVPDPDITVDGKINLNRLIQLELEALHGARHPNLAARAVARLYTLVKGLRDIDEDFAGEWREIYGGYFIERCDRNDEISWRSVWAAQEALGGLLER